MNLSSSPPPDPARVVPMPNGPYEVTGPLVISRPDDDHVELPGSKVYLCRCGGSANKPFCDGSHARNEWKDGS